VVVDAICFACALLLCYNKKGVCIWAADVAMQKIGDPQTFAFYYLRQRNRPAMQIRGMSECSMIQTKNRHPYPDIAQ
jgi:hypothetical protein